MRQPMDDYEEQQETRLYGRRVLDKREEVPTDDDDDDEDDEAANASIIREEERRRLVNSGISQVPRRLVLLKRPNLPRGRSPRSDAPTRISQEPDAVKPTPPTPPAICYCDTSTSNVQGTQQIDTDEQTANPPTTSSENNTSIQNDELSIFDNVAGFVSSTSLTLEQREQAYEEARRRIFGSPSIDSQNPPSTVDDIALVAYTSPIGNPRPVMPRSYRCHQSSSSGYTTAGQPDVIWPSYIPNPTSSLSSNVCGVPYYDPPSQIPNSYSDNINIYNPSLPPEFLDPSAIHNFRPAYTSTPTTPVPVRLPPPHFPQYTISASSGPLVNQYPSQCGHMMEPSPITSHHRSTSLEFRGAPIRKPPPAPCKEVLPHRPSYCPDVIMPQFNNDIMMFNPHPRFIPPSELPPSFYSPPPSNFFLPSPMSKVEQQNNLFAEFPDYNRNANDRTKQNEESVARGQTNFLSLQTYDADFPPLT